MNGSASPADAVIPKEHFPSAEFMTVIAQPEFFREAKSRRSLSFFWARNALFYSLQALGISPGAQVLLPAYLCTAAVEPFIAFGAEVQFYGVGRNCQPDFSEIESKITSRTKAILAVHYFGFPQNIREFRAVCDRHGVALIEDCAHVLAARSDGQPLGTFGDAGVFSWRKFLPVYDGGELWLKSWPAAFSVDWARESLPFTLKVGKSLLDHTLENSSSVLAELILAGVEGVGRSVKRLKGMGKNSTDAAPPLFALDSEESSFDRSLLNQKMSRVSRWMRKHTNVPAVVAKRRQNFQFLRERLRSVTGFTPLHEQLAEDMCPWVFPGFLDGVADPHLRLQQLRVPAVNWDGVRPANLQRGAFPDVDFLYKNLVFLPVHQNLSPVALEAIVEAVRNVCAGAVASRACA